MLDVSEGFGGNARNCGKRSEKYLYLRRITRAGVLAEFAALGLVWCVESADHPGGVPGRNPAQVIPQYANAASIWSARGRRLGGGEDTQPNDHL